VVGVPTAGVGELRAVAVALGEAPAVTVGVGEVVAVAVAVGVGEGTAPSSRNNILGLLHHFNFASGRFAGSAVGVGLAGEDAKGLEQETSSNMASKALNAREEQAQVGCRILRHSPRDRSRDTSIQTPLQNTARKVSLLGSFFRRPDTTLFVTSI
jgi:hypothetical protein